MLVERLRPSLRRVLPASRRQQHRLDWTDRCRRHGDGADSRGRTGPLPKAACPPFRRTTSRACCGACPPARYRAACRRNGRPRMSNRSADPGIAAIHRHGELEEIVGADGHEIDLRHQFVQLPEQRRHFQHGADIAAAWAVDGRILERCCTSFCNSARDLASVRRNLSHHRNHDAQVRVPAAAFSKRPEAASGSGPACPATSRIARQPSAGFSLPWPPGNRVPPCPTPISSVRKVTRPTGRPA